ncbi:hypothetical protein E2C01_024808 [Portunus trituberculatus]|uniref:Uncharacterized protein n=1 Tax=Portunus trituberculatus TaxID=210409 RepID=A0A5B7EE80_PORTR|nr:hypothetical protein [Portunus trituberculatus]
MTLAPRSQKDNVCISEGVCKRLHVTIRHILFLGQNSQAVVAPGRVSPPPARLLPQQPRCLAAASQQQHSSQEMKGDKSVAPCEHHQTPATTPLRHVSQA